MNKTRPEAAAGPGGTGTGGDGSSGAGAGPSDAIEQPPATAAVGVGAGAVPVAAGAPPAPPLLLATETGGSGAGGGPKALQPHPQPHPTAGQQQLPPRPVARSAGGPAPPLLPYATSTMPPPMGAGAGGSGGDGGRVRPKDGTDPASAKTTPGVGTGVHTGMTIQAAAAAAAYRQQQLQLQQSSQAPSRPKQLTSSQRSTPLPPPQHRTQPRGSAGGRGGPVAAGLPSPDLLKAIADRQAFYMFKFRTTFCPLFAQYKCDQAKPYTCKFAHYENHLRREPKLMPNGRWSYSASLCPHASLLECPNGPECKNSHRMQKEHVFHPSTYKTQYCEAPFNGNYDDCVIYGPHCSKAHGPLDIRQAEQLSDDEPGSARTDASSEPAHHPPAPAALVAAQTQAHPGVGTQPLPAEHGHRNAEEFGAGAFQPPTINITLPTVGGGAQHQTEGFPGPMPLAPEFGAHHGSHGNAGPAALHPHAQPAPVIPNPQRPASRGSALTAKAPEWTPAKPSAGAMTPADRAVKELEHIPQPALTPPLPTIPEQPEHEKYMYSFRVAVCDPSVPCANDSYTCFNAHADTPRRRKPQLVHGRYNYIPTRCRYVLEDKECPQGIHCRFAHCTEEVIYHPSKYKTQICSHQTDQNGHCTGYGMHCAKAHGEEDRRIPIFECMEEGINANVTAADFDQFVCPPQDRPMERQFYMYLYKTKKCEGFPWDCQCNGFDYHRAEERRRGPIIKYSPVACPNVKSYLNAEWGDPNTDACKKSVRQIKRTLPDGREEVEAEEDWECEYAHTLLELMYHPQVYKTGLCDHFDENDTARWKCVWKRRCAHAHGKGDLRSKEEAMESWREHSQLVAALQSRAPTRGEDKSSAEVKFVVPPGGTAQWLDGRVHTRSPAQGYAAAKDSSFGAHSRASPVLSTRSTSSPGSPMRRAFAPPHTMRPDLFAQARALQRAASPRVPPQSLAARVPSRLASVSTSRDDLRLGAAKPPDVEDLGRFSYFKDRVLDVGSNGVKVFEGFMPSGAAVGVKVIPKLAVADLATVMGDVNKLCKLGASREMHFFTRYLDSVETQDTIAIALEVDDMRADPTVARVRMGRSVKELIAQLKADPTRSGVQPLIDPAEVARLTQQIFISLFSLHRLDIVHGDIGPHSVYLTRTGTTSAVRMGDIARGVRKLLPAASPGLTMRRMSAPTLGVSGVLEAGPEARKRELEMGKQRDVVAAACVVYYLMTGGRFPFDMASEVDSIALLEGLKDKLSVPLDTTALDPVATHLIVNTLLSQPDHRLSAEQALRHPLFFSAMRRLHFLACVSAEVSRVKQGAESNGQQARSSPAPPGPAKAARRSLSPPQQPQHRTGSGSTKLPRSASSDSIARSSPMTIKPSAAEGNGNGSGIGGEREKSPDVANDWKSMRLKSEVDELAIAVLPRNPASAGRHEWRFSVAPLLELIPARRQQPGDESVMALIHFVSDCLEVCCPTALLDQIDARAVAPTQCRVHELLGLGSLHVPACAAVRAEQQRAAPATPAVISEALGQYFFSRFPALLPSAFHLVWKYWKDQSHGIFAHLLSVGPFPPLLASRGGSLEPRRDALPAAAGSSGAAPVTAPAPSPPAPTLAVERFAGRAYAALQCPFADGAPHLLDDPIMTLCCGKTFCRNCLPTYLQYAANNVPNRHSGQPMPMGVSGRCECGRQFGVETRHELARQPVNQALGLLTQAYLQKLDTEASANATAGGPPGADGRGGTARQSVQAQAQARMTAPPAPLPPPPPTFGPGSGPGGGPGAPLYPMSMHSHGATAGGMPGPMAALNAGAGGGLYGQPPAVPPPYPAAGPLMPPPPRMTPVFPGAAPLQPMAPMHSMQMQQHHMQMPPQMPPQMAPQQMASPMHPQQQLLRPYFQPPPPPLSAMPMQQFR